MLEKTGIPTAEDLQKVMPSAERLARGPVAIIECFQKIPCNPCSRACPRGAIRPMEDINELPQIDFEKCNGCALCVARCPGLAIFVVDMSYSEDQALVKLPWEFLPVPETGAVVKGLNRAGEEVGEATVVRVQDAAALDKTLVVHLAVPKELAMEVRSMALGGNQVE